MKDTNPIDILINLRLMYNSFKKLIFKRYLLYVQETYI